MKVIKRDEREVEYSKNNIKEAIMKATFDVTKDEIESDSIASEIAAITDITINERFKKPTVEEIQDLIEQNLMSHKYYDVAKAYILYREKQKIEREGAWLTGELSNSIWENKYRYGNETPEEFLRRVTNGDNDVAKLIRSKLFCPAGRILANRLLQNDGKKVSYSNCYVNPAPKDEIESIFETAGQLARTFSYGGGSGIDISNLRPNGAKVNNAANTTSGACSFMRLYDITSEIIGQKGRRAALMISLTCFGKNTNILTEDGWKTIQYIVENRYSGKVWTHKGFEEIEAYQKFKNEEILKVETNNGKTIKVTKDHKFVVKNIETSKEYLKKINDIDTNKEVLVFYE